MGKHPPVAEYGLRDLVFVGWLLAQDYTFTEPPTVPLQPRCSFWVEVIMDIIKFLSADEDVKRQEMKIGRLKKEIAKRGVEGMIDRFEDHEDVSEAEMKRAIREWEQAQPDF